MATDKILYVLTHSKAKKSLHLKSYVKMHPCDQAVAARNQEANHAL